MTTFALTLKNNRLQLYDKIAAFVILINLAVLILFSIYSVDSNIKSTSFFGSLLLTIALGIHFFLIRIKKNEGSPYLYAGFFLSFLTWLQIGNYWIAMFIFLLEIFYQLSKKIVVANFSEKKIVYSSIPKKIIEWRELNNVILKDGLLTVDFKNNKLLQSEIVNPIQAVNEKEFNEFCMTQLELRNKPGANQPG